MEYGTLFTSKPKAHSGERRRSSIFSLLKRQKKLIRQYSEPTSATFGSTRKFSVDSAIQSDYQLLDPRLNGYELKSERSELFSDEVQHGELAGAASDTDSDNSLGAAPLPPNLAANLTANMAASRAASPARVLELIEQAYVEDTNCETGAAGELVEEVAEENKSLLWFLLKQVRPGMDLSKVVLPTFILEPRSFLDKLSDNYYHADLLSRAVLLDDPYQRFMQVLRWYLSGLYRKPKGLKKPYNPVLGESFRCCWRHKEEDSYTFYVSEQVSHHPPVSAFYVSNRREGFVVEGSLLARSKFYGNSTSAILEGCATVHLLPRRERYITTAPYAHCKGIVIGTLSMELGGKVHVICPETGYQADVEFKLRSFLSSSSDTNAITGRIKKGKETIATVDGYWDGRIDVKDKRTGEETMLLDVSVLKGQRLPRYLMKLENQQDFESQRLWQHVSAAIANDDQVAATEQKTLVEEAQRARARDQTLDPWTPRYFRKDFGLVVDGVIDQGWQYTYVNTTPWAPDELIEYEEDFVIRSLRTGDRSTLRLDTTREFSVRDLSGREMSGRDLSAREISARDIVANRASVGSETDSQDDGPRTKTTVTRTLKQSLMAIDQALREQTHAIERLSRSVTAIGESQASLRRYFRDTRTATNSWDLFGGFILALVLQAVLNWVFTHKV